MQSPIPLPPLRVSDLLVALRPYVPNLSDITPLDGTDDFLLILGSPGTGDGEG